MSKTKRRLNSIGEIEITVPDDYDHDTQIASFYEKARKKEWNIHRDAEKEVTDFIFNNTVDRLVPGKTYVIKFFVPLVEGISTDEIFDFLENQGGLFVGVQGLTLMYQLKEDDELPYCGRKLSLDGKENTQANEKGDIWIPAFGRHGFRLSLLYLSLGYDGSGSMEDISLPPDCLLCFTEKK